MRPSRSLLTGVIGVVVMLAVLLVVGQLSDRPARQAPPVTPAPAPATATSPSSSPPGATASTSPPQPPQLRGPPLAGTGLEVLLLPAAASPHGRPARFARDTGRRTPVGGLPAGGCSYSATRLAHAWALEHQAYGSPQQPCLSARAELYLLPDGARTASRLGTSDGVLAAADGTGLWRVTLGRGPDQASPQHAQELDLAGRARTPSYPVPGGYFAVQDLGGGRMLLARSEQGSGDPDLYELWSVGRGRVLRRFDRVLAASATTVAWVAAGCDRGECPVHRTDLASSRDATVPSPPDA